MGHVVSMRILIACLLFVGACSENKDTRSRRVAPVRLGDTAQGDNGLLGDPAPDGGDVELTDGGDAGGGDKATPGDSGGDAETGDSLLPGDAATGDSEPLPGDSTLDNYMVRGLFTMTTVSGSVGTDLEGILTRENEWYICMNDVTSVVAEDTRYFFADNFDFGFVGPDSAVLNDVVTSQLTKGLLQDGALLGLIGPGAELPKAEAGEVGKPASSTVYFYIGPEDPTAGITLLVKGAIEEGVLTLDSEGVPEVQSFSVATGLSASLFDYRTDPGGSLISSSSNTLATSTVCE